MTWYNGLTFRGLKDIKTKGDLFRRCLNTYRSKTKDSLMTRDVAIKADVSPQRMSQFVHGQWEDMPEDILVKIVETIMPYKEFKMHMGKTAIPGIGRHDPNFGKPATTPQPKTKPKPKQQSTPTAEAHEPASSATPASAFLTKKPKKDGTLGITIHSNILEGYLAVVSTNSRSITIYDNTPGVIAKLKKAKKKWVYIAPADQIGEEIVQRSTNL